MTSPTPPSTLPSELKPYAPFLQRAEELRTRDTVMSYYCKFYVAKTTITHGLKGSKPSQLFLLSLMDELESIKTSPSVPESIVNPLVGQAYVENFGLKVFMKADNEDRIHSGDESWNWKSTARTFLAASIFLQVLKVFVEDDDENDDLGEVEEKIRYAKWRAAEILKALKEGRVPVVDTTFDNTTENHETGDIPLPSIPTNTSIDNLNTPLTSHLPETSGISESTEISELIPFDPKTIQSAQKFAKFAISALQYDDVNNAIENLEKAIVLLRPLQKQRQ